MNQEINEMKIKIPEGLLKNIDILVRGGIYPNRNEAIRDAIRQNIKGEAS